MNAEPMLFTLDQKDAYRQIRHFLAGRFVGATRDRALLAEVVKCLFCRAYQERLAHSDSYPSSAIDLAKLYRRTFAALRKDLPAVFGQEDEIMLDPASIAFVHEQLLGFDLEHADRDPFGDLYEVFIGTGIREEEGQFFTPQNGVDLLVSVVDPRPGERMIDPACGAGGFVSATARHLMQHGASPEQVADSVFGIEKDAYVASLATTRLSLLTMLPSAVVCGDSLAWKGVEGEMLPLQQEGYDVVLTNPPFGKRIVAASREVQRGFELGYKWANQKRTGRLAPTTELTSSVPPQVLFIERCLSLLRPGGRLGIVVPESLVTSKKYSHVVQYMRDRAVLQAIIGMPEDFFKTSGKGGTHTKACLIALTKLESDSESGNKPLFMAEAKDCGHDSRGRRTERDDLPAIKENYAHFTNGGLVQQGHLGYGVELSNLHQNILSPRYYNPNVDIGVTSLSNTHELLRLGDLISSGLIELATGHEVGKSAYGTGPIPFVRTSDLSNWEIKIDPKHGVSEEVYRLYAQKQDVQPNDILMVRDGTYLIGTCALITHHDTRILYQSHIYKIRVTDPSLLSPFLLLAALSSEPVQRQIKAKRFTQDIIDSLGDRIHDLILAIPKEKERRERIRSKVEQAIHDRIEARELARQACAEITTAA
jgi:type I restriction enzyme M protein